MKKVSKWLFFLLTIGFVFSACNELKKDKEVQQEETTEEKHTHAPEKEDHGYEIAMSAYQCPMKCEGDKTYDEQGACPVCKMDLKKAKAVSDEESAEQNEKE